MSAHTPGPWSVGVGHYETFGILGNGHTVADVYETGSMKENRANAVLLAAAPAMLEELRNGYEDMQDMLDAGGLPPETEAALRHRVTRLAALLATLGDEVTA